MQRIGTAEERLSVGREIEALEKKLADVEAWEKRVSELERMLGAEKWEPEDKAEVTNTTIEEEGEGIEPVVDDFDETTSEFGAPSVSDNGSEAVAITESMLQE